MVKSKQKQQLDLADRIAQVQAHIDEINREIENIQDNSPVALPSCPLALYSRRWREVV